MKINLFRGDSLNHSPEELDLETNEFEKWDLIHVRDWSREQGDYSEQYVILDIISEDEEIVALVSRK